MSSTVDVQTTIKATHWLNYVFAIPMIIFGLIGSILTALVFARRRAFWQNPIITTIHRLIVLANGFGIVLCCSEEPFP
ncbi:unnamed protein product [Adineta ricciae]|uniref:Uncharacterized protein n=1 Tax=Adineta ricciae TaxID=249248 RepID=A0A815N318_ADIRI|nr:unnamed protein product [Adineta ricciae]CAF1428573.1 unnamed protein product [Adineta ricciae]